MYTPAITIGVWCDQLTSLNLEKNCAQISKLASVYYNKSHLKLSHAILVHLVIHLG